MDDSLYPGHIVRNVPDDERVGPGIDLDLASWAETAFRDVDGLRRIAVIEVDDARHELFGFQRRFFRLGGVIPEPGDVGQGVDPQDVPFADLPQVVQLEYEVERLVPRHVQQFQRHLRLDRFPDDHVETADVGDQAEHAADLCVLEVQGDALPGESLGAAEPANIGRLIRFRLGQRRQRIEEFEPFRHRHRHAAPWAYAGDLFGRARSGTSYRLRFLRSLHCQGLFRQRHPKLRPGLLDDKGDGPTQIEHQPHFRLRELVHANPNLPHELVSNGHSRSEEHTSELQSRPHLVCRLLLEKKKRTTRTDYHRDYSQ